MKNLLRSLYLAREARIARLSERQQALARLSWSPDRMSDYAMAQVAKLVDFAYRNVPFYKESFDSVGYSEGELRTWEDFESLPVLTKSDLRAALADRTIFATDKQYRFTKASTTGSTGTPLTLYFDQEGIASRNINLWRLSFLLSMQGGSPLVQLWREKKSSLRDHIAQYLGLRMTIPVLDVDNAAGSALDRSALDSIINGIAEFDTAVLRGYVSALESVAQRISETGSRIPTLQRIITSAEALTESQWHSLEAAFGCSVHNLYGSTETPCLAVNISASHEMSIFDDFYRLEILDEESDQPKSVGSGRVVVTDYFMRGMPLIRYENGDLADLGDGTPGNHPFRTLKNVLGRINDKFVLPDGRIFYSHLWHIFFRDMQSLSRFQVTQLDAKNILILLEPTDRVALENEVPRLRKRVEDSLGQSVSIKITIVDHISLGKGEKYRAVRSLVRLGNEKP